jgi:hypothetical protein
VPVASASKWGVEGGTEFVGSSLVCGADGHVLASCGTGETTLAVAEVVPRRARPPFVTDDERVALRRGGPSAARVASPAVVELRIEREAGLIRLRAAGGHELVCDTRFARMTELGPLRVGLLPASDVGRFAAARVMGQQGAHLLVCGGPLLFARFAATRAAENRVYLVHAGGDALHAYDPRGQRIASDAGRVVFEVDSGAVADKCVTRDTDIFAGRVPGCYEF